MQNLYEALKSHSPAGLSHINRFAKEYSASPSRGYGSGVIQVLKKLASPQLSDVYQPARDQFNGRGSFGNGGAMRAVPFALAFPDVADVKKVKHKKKITAMTIETVQIPDSASFPPPPFFFLKGCRHKL